MAQQDKGEFSNTATYGCAGAGLLCIVAGMVWSVKDAFRYGMSWSVIGGLFGYPIVAAIMCAIAGLFGGALFFVFKRAAEGAAIFAALMALLAIFIGPSDGSSHAETPAASTNAGPATAARPHPNIGETWYVQDHAYTSEVYNDIVSGSGPDAYPAQTDDTSNPDRSFHFSYPFPCRVKSEGQYGYFACAIDGRGMIDNQTVWTDHLMTKAQANAQSPDFTAATAPAPKKAAWPAKPEDALLIRVDKAERAKARALLARATELYHEAQAIVARAPTTQAEALDLAQPENAAGIFYSRERAYQDAQPDRSLGKAVRDSYAFDAESNLLQLDSFLYGAVLAAVASCNVHDAQLNLKVVSADLAEARRALAGHGLPDYEPPDISNDINDKSLCS